MVAHRTSAFRGRASEREALDRLLDNVRGGQSAVLAIRGEAGVGKSALLRYAARQASGFRLAEIAAVESEMELSFAGLHQLCSPMLAGLEAVPAPQQAALSVALGLSTGDPPDRFLVALAALGLLSEVAASRPLLCLVDDAQWLDGASSQVLGFIARRLLAESVAIVFAVRAPSGDRWLAGLPELTLEGLTEEDARALLASVVPGRLDERVRDRIVSETRGNPRALLDLPGTMSTAELAGGFALADHGGPPGRIEGEVLRRLDDLPEATQRLMLLAAADPAGDATLLWRAAVALGVEKEAVAAAAGEQLLEIGAGVRFSHPLARSAVYRMASLSDRARVHEALSEVTDPEVDPDRRAWHRAQATLSPDEEVATELEHSAGRAQARGGLPASAAFLDRAAGLTADPARRAQRALAAAQAKHQAGALEAALRLLAAAEAGPLDELGHARVDLLRAHIAHSQNHGGDAGALLLPAAKRLEPLDPGLARETYLDALWAAQFAGRPSGSGGLHEVAQAALAAPPRARVPRACDLLLDGWATTFVAGFAAGAPTLKRAVSAFRSDDISSEEALRWSPHAAIVALDLWDHDSFDLVAARHIQLARETGALTVLPVALSSRILAQALAGELLDATRLIEEVRTVIEAIDSPVPPYGPITVAGVRGREAELTRLIEAIPRPATSRGEDPAFAGAHHARALLCNGLGRYQEALTSAMATQLPGAERMTMSKLALVELIEAAARTGNAAQASSALRRLSEITSASGSDWALGIEARSRALLSHGELAERLYREAIDRLSRTRVRVELARARLLYGEWLRRENRRVDAREQLRIAREMLDTMGVEGFADRARRELLATGEKVRKRREDTRDDLTPQEERIASLARDGRTNPEIGAELYLSPRTVEWHLKKVFTKLGINSRKGLHGSLPSRDGGTTLAQPRVTGPPPRYV